MRRAGAQWPVTLTSLVAQVAEVIGNKTTHCWRPCFRCGTSRRGMCDNASARCKRVSLLHSRLSRAGTGDRPVLLTLRTLCIVCTRIVPLAVSRPTVFSETKRKVRQINSQPYCLYFLLWDCFIWTKPLGSHCKMRIGVVLFI